MGLLQFFNAKDRTFVPLFVTYTGNLVSLAETLEQLLKVETSKWPQLVKQAQEIDAKGEGYNRKVTVELGHNFITPFDREDIHELATAIGAAHDYLHGSLKRIALYDIKSIDPHFGKLANQILRGAKALQEATQLLESLKNSVAIEKACDQIKKIEVEADDTFEEATSMLFRDEKDPIELVKKREVLESLETATDRIDDAANVIRSILIKYA